MAPSPPKKNKPKPSGSPLLKAGLSLSIAILSAVFANLTGQLPFLKRAELMSLDLRYRIRKPIEIHPDIGYVNLDGDSCELAGPWPWPRSTHVALIKSLGFYGARAAGYDVFFSEPSPIEQHPAPDFSHLDEDEKLTALSQMFRDSDEDLHQAIATSNIIYLGDFFSTPEQFGLGKDLSPDEFKQELIKKTSTLQASKKSAIEVAQDDGWPADEKWSKYTEKALDITPPLSKLSATSKGVGFEQIIPDNTTGTVYEYPMFLEYDGTIYPALGMLMAADILEVDLKKVSFTPGESVVFHVNKATDRIETGPLRVPINQKLRSLMNWSDTYFDSFFHVNYRQLATFHGVNEIKKSIRAQAAKGAQPSVSLLQTLLAKNADHNWMDQGQAKTLTQQLMTAWFTAEHPELERQQLLDQLKTMPECYGSHPENTIDATRFADHIRTSSMASDREKVALQVHSRRFLNYRPKLMDTQAYPSLSEEHAKEIARNVLWFQHQERLSDVAPHYFPERLTCPENWKDSTISPTMLHNKVLMIGLEGEGTIDLNPQPHQENCAMVALHANVLNAFLTNQFLQFPEDSKTWLLLLLLSLSIAMVSQFLGIKISLPTFLLMLSGLSYHVYLEFSEHGRHLEWIIPAFGLSLSYAISVGIKLYIAIREKAKMKGMFGKMVSPDVLKEMTDNPELFSLTGQRKACTSTFSSMENYADIVKGVTPQEMTGLLRSYLTPASQIITSYKGYIDKYEGHIIMSEFGVPVARGDHRQQCLYASIEQQLDVVAFKHHIKQRTAKEINISIGVNTGFVSAGNMGSDKKMQYTIMGDTVNTAARFRPANWIYDNLGSTIIGEGTYVQVKDIVQTRPLDRLLLKGKRKPVNIYEVRGWNPEAYLASRGQQDVTETLQVCWSDHCPSGKVLGYHRHFKEQHQRIEHPLALELSQFFESQFDLAAARNSAALKNEIAKNGSYYLSLEERFNAITNQHLSDIPEGPWQEKFTRWQTHLGEHLQLLHGEHRGDPKADRLHRDLLDVEEKVAAQKKRLGTEQDLPKAFATSWSQIRDFACRAFERDDNDYQQHIDELNQNYITEASALVSSVSERMEDYHHMMSAIGSMTKPEIGACEHYAKGLELHWQRNWTGAIDAFKSCHIDLPEDKASSAMIARIQNYQNSPPPPSWQGEFAQTKK
jgi:class 3 adenylate cyclase/CHASE2 domain-containing sensor protein